MAGWLIELIEATVATSNLTELRNVADHILASGRDVLEAAEDLALARCDEAGLTRGLPVLPDAIGKQVEGMGHDPGEMAWLAILTCRIRVALLACALAEKDPSDPVLIREMIAVLGLGDGLLNVANAAMVAPLGGTSVESGSTSLSQTNAAFSPRETLIPVAYHIEKVYNELSLHNSPVAVAVMAGLATIGSRTIASAGLHLFRGAFPDDPEIKTLLDRARDEQRAFIDVMVAVAWADGQLLDSEKDILKLHAACTQPGEEYQFPEKPASLDESLNQINWSQIHPETARLIMGQALLLSLADGERDISEEEVIMKVANKVGMEMEELFLLEMDAIEFFDQNEKYLDGTPGFEAVTNLRSHIGNLAGAAIKKNTARLGQEIRETGDLMALVAKASHKKLTPEEKKRAKGQLLDICRSVPALAIFALPGGGLLLPVLLKFLPFDLLPSAFRDEITS